MPVVHIEFSSSTEADNFAEAVNSRQPGPGLRSVTGISLTHPENRKQVITRLAALGYISARGGAGMDIRLDYADWQSLLRELESQPRENRRTS